MVITHVYDPVMWDIWFEGTPRTVRPKELKTAKEWAESAKADVAYNLGFFDAKTHKTTSYVKSKGQDLGPLRSQNRLTVSPGNVCGSEPDEDGKKWGLGIKDNEVIEPSGGDYRSQNGIGITARGKIIIAQTNGRSNRRDFCTEVKRQVKVHFKDTVKLFLMENGGKNTQSYSNFSKLDMIPELGCPVATVTCVRMRVRVKLSRTLTIGMSGEDVRLLQMILGDLECDGVYGNITKARVKAAQKALGITEDGTCGLITLKALGLA